MFPRWNQVVRFFIEFVQSTTPEHADLDEEEWEAVVHDGACLEYQGASPFSWFVNGYAMMGEMKVNYNSVLRKLNFRKKRHVC